MPASAAVCTLDFLGGCVHRQPDLQLAPCSGDAREDVVANRKAWGTGRAVISMTCHRGLATWRQPSIADNEVAKLDGNRA